MFLRFTLLLPFLVIPQFGFSQVSLSPTLTIDYLKNPGGKYGVSSLDLLKNREDQSPSLGGLKGNPFQALQNGQKNNAKINCLQEARDTGKFIPGLDRSSAFYNPNLREDPESERKFCKSVIYEFTIWTNDANRINKKEVFDSSQTPSKYEVRAGSVTQFDFWDDVRPGGITLDSATKANCNTMDPVQ